jgi:hypothetical protein
VIPDCADMAMDGDGSEMVRAQSERLGKATNQKHSRMKTAPALPFLRSPLPLV